MMFVKLNLLTIHVGCGWILHVTYARSEFSLAVLPFPLNLNRVRNNLENGNE